MEAVVQSSFQFHQASFDVSRFIAQGADLEAFYTTDLGALFDGDCLEILPLLANEIADVIFADPPFNLNKEYGKKTDDNRSISEYLEWCYRWIDECLRVLKPGGAIFIYNLPKWNIKLGSYLMDAGMTFRHDIAIDMRNCLPISGRLYPSHYSLLYFTKGKPKTFRKIRTPIEKCRHCDGDLRDYGGHRKSMNPNGVNLRDVWSDIPPVRHWKFKSQKRKANSLSTKILDRVIELSTQPGDLVLDPFGGSGTTFSVCESKERHWIGVELDFSDIIKERLETKNIAHHKNNDYVEK
jgi:site-specific DNA-methyltransferase (adenine-specific)